MLTFRLWIAICTLLLADMNNVNAESVDNIPEITLDMFVGDSRNVIMPQMTMAEKQECFITPPNAAEVVAIANFDHSGISEVEGNDCGVKVTVTSEEMVGQWLLSGQYTLFGSPVERRLPFTINIKDVTTEIAEIEKEEVEKRTWLTPIEHVTRTDANIDITLSSLPDDEDCYLKPPNGEFAKVGQASITGVTYHSKSDYVSCRVTIGPMDEALLGNWTICGRYFDTESHERCQIVSIRWNNINNPSDLWQATRQPMFNHAVHVGGTLTPVVIGSGSILTCHIVTPEEEDLVITDESRYPGITRSAGNSASTCSVAIGPIGIPMLGNWTLYGKFRNTFGLNEVVLPMNLFLYDEENPTAQAYNVTDLGSVNRVINLGSRITEEVTGTGNIDNCYYRSPKGTIFEINRHENFYGVSFVNTENVIACRISMGPITEEMLGEWQVIGKFNNGFVFNERRLTFNVIQEDPENPIIEDDRRVVNLTAQHYDVDIGSSLTIRSTLNSFVVRQTCHVRTPSGLQYTIMEGFNLPGVEPIEGTNIECGINITVLSEDMVGEWTLISRVLSLSEPIERRLPFTIYVEEIVSAMPENITVVEGNSIYVRLTKPTSLYNTCKLIAPNDNGRFHEVDSVYSESCGYVIKNAQQLDNGKWEIMYGNNIVYRAFIHIDVIERHELGGEKLILHKDSQVNMEYGPEDAVYCKIVDPTELVVFEGFGKCNIVIDRVLKEHQGYWQMHIGLPGHVLETGTSFWVTVKDPEPKAVVTTHVVRERPNVILTCSVSSSHQVRACKFRNPHGQIRIAALGVGEDRYISENSQVTYESELQGHKCGLRITEPTEEDLGLWRCAIETEGETHYGFFSVLCPWLLLNPEIEASVVTEPVLSVDRSEVTSVEGDFTTMSCSIQSSIRYCYFRARNGTVFNIAPGMNSAHMEYVGNGFDAGECGVRFKNLLHTDSGRWSCHVGLMNNSEQEQRSQFEVTIKEAITVRHYQHEQRGLLVEATVFGNRALEYCRYVRIDGLGFTSDNPPNGYNDLSSLENGNCLLEIEVSTMLNIHPWTVVVKVRGQDVELSKMTSEMLFQFEEETDKKTVSIHVWITIILLGFAFILLGLSLGPKNNRRWTYARATELRNSFRNSFRKQKAVEAA